MKLRVMSSEGNTTSGEMTHTDKFSSVHPRARITKEPSMSYDWFLNELSKLLPAQHDDDDSDSP